MGNSAEIRWRQRDENFCFNEGVERGTYDPMCLVRE